MKRMLVDVSSIGWTSLMFGKDEENGIKVEHEGKQVLVNSCWHGYENAMTYLTDSMKRHHLVPSDTIFVVEGMNSKTLRRSIMPSYKEGSDNRTPAAFEEFNKMKAMLLDAWCSVGATAVWQDGIEADDVIAYLARELDGERIILTNDGDLAACVAPGVHLWRKDEMDQNPYGPFPHKYITLYKALVGDSSDNIPGAKGYGPKAFLDTLCAFGEDGLAAFEDMIKRNKLEELQENVPEQKALQKVIDNAEMVVKSYRCAKLYPDKVNTLRMPLMWRAGMVKRRMKGTDERLKPYAGIVKLVHVQNYQQAVEFIRERIDETPFFTLDLETWVAQESLDWLTQRSKSGGGVDVLGSMITGCGLTFGDNNQYGFYFSVDHAKTDNITLEQLGAVLKLIPKSKLTVAHNAAGFELPVLFNHFGEAWEDNGWRGFFPNMVDSRIAASYYDENLPSHGLKQLSKGILGYEQDSFKATTTIVFDPESRYQGDAEVTVVREGDMPWPGGRLVEEGDGWEKHQYEMNCLPAEHVLSYGVDDVFTTTALFNFFRTVMAIEKTYDTYLRLEQKPMYLSAMAYVEGLPISLERLFELKKKDDAAYETHSKLLNEFLIEKGWEGTVCPEYTELTPAAIKEIYQIVTGQELKTAVRTIEKLGKLIATQDVEDAVLLGKLVEEQNTTQLTNLVRRHFSGKPQFDEASPKQMQHLLYDVMGLPIRLRNKATDVMRAKGITEGTPRTDDDSILMALKMNDAEGRNADVLKALMEMKSINTRRGLYWESYPKMMHWKTRKMHPEFVQCSTNTRRYTGRNPNFQQQSSDVGGVRSVVLAHHKDAVVVSLDESAQEIRILGDLSGDKNIKASYDKKSPKDLHSFTASMILNVSYDEFMLRRKSEDKAIAAAADAARQNGKVTFFASSYGAMAPKIAEGLGITKELAQSYLDALDRAFPRVNVWKDEVEGFAQSHGWVPIYGGNVRHLRDAILSDNKWEASKALRQASNASIQAAGGNQIRRIMGRLWDSKLFEQYDVKFYFTVHDEALISVNRKDAVPVIQAVHTMMCEQFLNEVVSESSIGIGHTYGDLVEIGTEASAELIEKTVASLFEDTQCKAA